MNIIEAIKSGKPFKKPIWPSFRKPLEPNELVHINRDEFLREDWEIEEEKIEITRERLSTAYNAAFPHVDILYVDKAITMLWNKLLEVISK